MERNDIIKALECCISGDDCTMCPLLEEQSCTCVLNENALALINSQEQRIDAYRQELGEVRVALAEKTIIFVEMDKQIERLTEEVASWKAIAEGYQKQFEDCAEDRSRLSEENERLHASCTELTRKCASLEVDVAKEFTCVFGTPHKVSECPINDEIAKAKAETVRNMQERVQSFLTDDETEVIIAEGEVFIPISAFRKIAKEMVEGGD